MLCCWLDAAELDAVDVPEIAVLMKISPLLPSIIHRQGAAAVTGNWLVDGTAAARKSGGCDLR